MTYRVSVVIPTFKRPDLLEHCLHALTQQDISPTDFEVIVVDDAASDATRQQVECWSERHKACGYTFRYLPVTGAHGPAAARNCGWRVARSEIIAFTDDDCLPSPGWLRAGLAAFNEDIVGVAGKLIVPLDHTPTDYEYNAAMFTKVEFITANCFYRHCALAMVGGFDERFTMAWREDSDLVFSLVEAFPKREKAVLVSAPQAVVVHPIRPARWGISIKQQRKSIFNALLYKKHPNLYCQRIQSTPPVHYYCIIIALLIALIAALAGAWWLALTACCVWLYLTARFVLLRLRHTSHSPRHILEMLVTSIVIPPLAIYWRIVGAIKFDIFFL